MGAENILQTGVNFRDEKGTLHNFKLGMKAQAWLARKHKTISRVYDKLSGRLDENGEKIVIKKEYDAEGNEVLTKVDMTECQLEALIDIAYAGLIRDYENRKESFTRDDALNLVDDLGYATFTEIISGTWVDTFPDSEGPVDPTSAQA